MNYEQFDKKLQELRERRAKISQAIEGVEAAKTLVSSAWCGTAHLVNCLAELELLLIEVEKQIREIGG